MRVCLFVAALPPLPPGASRFAPFISEANPVSEDKSPKTKCAICGKPISPEDFNVKEDGKAVHAECYFEKIRKRKSEEQLRSSVYHDRIRMGT
jgi:hypothetical protein